MNRFRPIVLGAHIVSVLTILFFGLAATPAHAKQCHAQRPSDASTYWSYRLIDGRKCWYEGKPGFSKSLLSWPAGQTAKATPRREPDPPQESRQNPLNAQASISDTPDVQPKPNAQVVDRSPAQPKGTLTPDDLRAWGSTMAAMAAQPVLTIMDRWPDQEMPQIRNTPVPAAQSSGTGGRAILTVVIMLMTLSAVLVTTLRKKSRIWRVPFWPAGAPRKRTAAWY
jgi:hypothetical protein